MTSTSTTKDSRHSSPSAAGSGLPLKLAIAWTVVGVPLAYGVLKTVQKAAPLFA